VKNRQGKGNKENVPEHWLRGKKDNMHHTTGRGAGEKDKRKDEPKAFTRIGNKKKKKQDSYEVQKGG